jgi:hypothetical protein
MDSSVRRRRIGRTWVLSVAPEVYAAAVHELVASEPAIEVLCGTRVTEVIQSNGSIGQLLATNEWGSRCLDAHAVIDATGTAEIVRQANPELLDEVPSAAAAGLVIRIRGVASAALEFPRGLGIVKTLRTAAAEGKLPPACDKAWVDQGVRPNEAYVKLFVPLPPNWRDRDAHTNVTRCALEMKAAVLQFILEFPGFEHAVVDRVGSLGVRDGGRVRGEYQLTGEDVRELRTFPDAACRCSWPIEYWDSQSGLFLEYLPDGGYYEIPLRALKVQGLSNVWAAGKCLAADPIAQASARVVGTCWSMGEAVGKAAVCAGTNA